MFFTSRSRFALLALAFIHAPARAGEEPAGWKKAEAAQYLDARAKTWFAFASASRGEAESKSFCLSCHTSFPYALARPVLRQLLGAEQPTEYETKLLEQTQQRVAHWE